MINYIGLSVVILVACVDVSTGYMCEGLHCVDDECSERDVCARGCQTGFGFNTVGQCVQSCPVNCRECIESVCTACVDGRYGNTCAMTCEGCVDGQCDLKSGHCVQGCKDGYAENPRCNVSVSGNNEMEQVAMVTDQAERNVYIWIASCLISAIIVAVVIIIIYISLQRKRGWKSYDVNIRYHQPHAEAERIELNEL